MFDAFEITRILFNIYIAAFRRQRASPFFVVFGLDVLGCKHMLYNAMV